MPVKASPGCELQELWIRVAIRRGAEGLRHIGCGISLLRYHVYYSHVSMGKPFQSGAKLPLLWWWKWYLFLMGQSWGDIFPQQEFSSSPSPSCLPHQAHVWPRGLVVLPCLGLFRSLGMTQDLWSPSVLEQGQAHAFFSAVFINAGLASQHSWEIDRDRISIVV